MTHNEPEKPPLAVATNEQQTPVAPDGPTPGFIPPVDLSHDAALSAEVADIAADIEWLLARSTYGVRSPTPAAPKRRSRPIGAFVVTDKREAATPRVIPSICDAHVIFLHREVCVQCGATTERLTFAGVRRTMANGARAYVAMTPELAKLASELPHYTRHEQTTVAHCAACVVPLPEEPAPVLPDEFVYVSKSEPLDDLRAFFSPSRQSAHQQMQRETTPDTED